MTDRGGTHGGTHARTHGGTHARTDTRGRAGIRGRESGGVFREGVCCFLRMTV